jgi:hypothetical protein
MHKRLKIAVVAICVAVAAAACGRQIGTRFDGTSVRSLTPGVSTLHDAVARLGVPPSRTLGLLGGRTLARWIYLKDTRHGTESARVDILFGSDNRMIRVVHQREHLQPGPERPAMQAIDFR